MTTPDAKLPEPDFMCGDCTNGEAVYTAAQMHAFREEGIREALRTAAPEAGEAGPPLYTYYAPKRAEVELALDYSRNFATAKPDILPMEKEHILGLCNLLERTMHAVIESEARAIALTPAPPAIAREVDAAMVLRGAKALYLADDCHHATLCESWDTLPDYGRDRYLDKSSAALLAALHTQEGEGT